MGCEGKKDRIRWVAVPAKDGTPGNATIQSKGRCSKSLLDPIAKLSKLGKNGHDFGVRTPLVARKSQYRCLGCGKALAGNPEQQQHQPVVGRMAMSH